MGKKFDKIWESISARHVSGGYLPGDFVTFRKNYKSADCYKSLPTKVQRELDELVKSGLNIRVTQVGNNLGGHSAQNQNKTSLSAVITVAGDQGGGRHYGMISVSPDMIDLVEDDYPNTGKVPDQFKRKDKITIKPEPYKADDKHITRVTDKGNGKNTPTQLKLAGESTMTKDSMSDMAMLYGNVLLEYGYRENDDISTDKILDMSRKARETLKTKGYTDADAAFYKDMDERGEIGQKLIEIEDAPMTYKELARESLIYVDDNIQPHDIYRRIAGLGWTYNIDKSLVQSTIFKLNNLIEKSENGDSKSLDILINFIKRYYPLEPKDHKKIIELVTHFNNQIHESIFFTKNSMSDMAMLYESVLEEGWMDRLKTRGAEALGSAKGVGKQIKGGFQQAAGSALKKAGDWAESGKLSKMGQDFSQQGQENEQEGGVSGYNAKVQYLQKNIDKRTQAFVDDIKNDIKKLGLDIGNIEIVSGINDALNQLKKSVGGAPPSSPQSPATPPPLPKQQEPEIEPVEDEPENPTEYSYKKAVSKKPKSYPTADPRKGKVKKDPLAKYAAPEDEEDEDDDEIKYESVRTGNSNTDMAMLYESISR